MKDDECLYVGKSVNLQSRWRAHEKLLEVADVDGLRLAWRPVVEARLDYEERRMIALLRPPLNRNLVPIVKPPLLKPRANIGAAMEGYITTTEAAEMLGVSSARVRQLVADGTIPAQKFGPVNMVKVSDLEAARNRPGVGRPPNPKPQAEKPKPARRASRKKGEAQT
jgi:excisionase family DNA binding protein